MRTTGDEPLVLTMDGRYIWAFTPARAALPVVDRDEERMTELLAAYRARL